MYLNDILIFSRLLKEHRSHVRQVLQWLMENKLYVKAENYSMVATPLTTLTSTKTPFHSNLQAETAFNDLKH